MCRGAGIKGSTIRLSVPEGDYDGGGGPGHGSAILLAGTYDQRTLLGVGEITFVDTTPAGSNTITANTSSVTFNVTPLTAEVQAAAASDFKITTAGMTTASHGNHNATGGIPYFKINEDSAANTASWQINGLTANAAAWILVNGAPVVANTSLVESGNNWLQPDLAFDSWGAAGDDFLAATLGTGTDGLIGITIDTTGSGTASGWAPIQFDIPVSAYGAASGADTWHIRSGLSYRLDAGDTGRGILLCIGTYVPLVIITP